MNTKLTWALFWLVWWFVLWGTYLVYTMWVDTQKVSANPDYICIKDVSRSCQIDYSNCTDWNTNWERTCYWTRVTQVAYYNRRTTCEKWYWDWVYTSTANSQISRRDAWLTNGRRENANKIYNNSNRTRIFWIRSWKNSGWKWWRETADFTYATNTCSITQVDTTPPDWETSTGN